MMKSSLKILFFVLVSIFSLTTPCHAEGNIQDRHINVSMRMIGHQILLNTGDSTSRILPIEKIEDRYKISFESEFEVTPEELLVIIHPIIEKSNIADQYIVEVEKCNSKEVVYSYEYVIFPEIEIPCGRRTLPKDCYHVFITLLDSGTPIASLKTEISPKHASIELSANEKQKPYFIRYSPVLIFLFLIGLSVYFWRKRSRSNIDKNRISIGEYQFDKKNMELSFENETIELTSKEADLLVLLHTSANNTLEREVILKIVWGDEGDYIGRTLDVFISKLRKRLEADSSVKIVNVRGIGYKLVINN